MNNSTETVKKRRITWITPDYFVDCDLNEDLLSGILTYFDIYWIVLLPFKNARFCFNDFTKIKELKGLKLEFIYWKCRARNPAMLIFYNKVYQRIKSLNSEIIYFNDTPTSPYILPLFWSLDKTKTIVTVHDGNINNTFKMAWLSKIVFKLAYKNVNFVHTFSLTQELVFKSIFRGVKSFRIPLALKDFGISNLSKRTDCIVFFFFGSIHSNKNLELLIDAGNNLYEKGVRGFKISINGSCDDWDKYKSRIKYSTIFECNIRMHKNCEIPDMCAQNHYMVFPYREMSQSGALKVAFNYCVPVIVSNLRGFTDEVKDGFNGFIFELCNVKDLERVMNERLKKYSIEYKLIQQNICQYNQEHYSKGVLINKYITMFNAR